MEFLNLLMKIFFFDFIFLFPVSEGINPRSLTNNLFMVNFDSKNCTFTDSKSIFSKPQIIAFLSLKKLFIELT